MKILEKIFKILDLLISTTFNVIGILVLIKEQDGLKALTFIALGNITYRLTMLENRKIVLNIRR